MTKAIFRASTVRAVVAGTLATTLSACAVDPQFAADFEYCTDAVQSQERGVLRNSH